LCKQTVTIAQMIKGHSLVALMMITYIPQISLFIPQLLGLM
ncbi:hypothetical protein, partial [Shigella boydii]